MERKDSPSFKVYRHRLCHKEIGTTIRTKESTPAKVALLELWERSNRLNVMFIKTKSLPVLGDLLSNTIRSNIC